MPDGGILTIRVMDEPRRRAFERHRLEECTPHQIGRHAVAHRVAHDLTAAEILDTGEIQPAFAGRDIGEISDPRLIRPAGFKLLIEPVRRHRQVMFRICRGLESADLLTANTELLAQPFDTPHTGLKSIGLQLRLQTFRAAGAKGAHVRGLDRYFQTIILLGTF